MTLASAALLLFLVMDPLGNIPFFLATLKNVAPERRRKVIGRELSIALAVMVIFLFAGRYILNLLHISEPSLSIAGGIILFLIAVRMIFPIYKGALEEVEGEPLIFPLAIPFIAGPSALATLLLITSREPERWPEWLAALLLAWLAAAVILYGAMDWLSRLMGPKGLVAMERLMGMLLTLIAVQMFMTGVTLFMSMAV